VAVVVVVVVVDVVIRFARILCSADHHLEGLAYVVGPSVVHGVSKVVPIYFSGCFSLCAWNVTQECVWSDYSPQTFGCTLIAGHLSVCWMESSLIGSN